MSPNYIAFCDHQGRWHREDGPAYISDGGLYKAWYRHGLKHREDGPAVTFGKTWFGVWISELMGINDYYLFDLRLTKEQFEDPNYVAMVELANTNF